MKKSNAFTLVELLVVMAIISILAALLLPSLKRAKEMSKRIACMNNLHQLSIALTTYADDNDGWLPNPCIYQAWQAGEYVGGPTAFTNPVSGAPCVMNTYNRLSPYTGNNRRVWLCPSFNDRKIGPFAGYFAWMTNTSGGPLSSSYSFLTYHLIVESLWGGAGIGGPTYGQDSLRVGQSIKYGGIEYKYDSLVIMHDVVALNGMYAGSFFSQHWDNGNSGGNVLRGGGSVEWMPFTPDRWVNAGIGYMFVQTAYQK